MKTFKEVYDNIMAKETKDIMANSNRMTQRDFCEEIWDYQQKRIREIAKINEGLIEITRLIEEHPEDYNGPCNCQLCQSCY